MINSRLGVVKAIRLLLSAGVKALGVNWLWLNINWLIIAREIIKIDQRVLMTLS